MLDVTHAAIAARLELFPERLHLSQVDLVEGNRHLAYGVIPAESVVIQHLQVQSALDHLLVREAWKRYIHTRLGTDTSTSRSLGWVRVLERKLLHRVFSSVSSQISLS